MSEYTTTRTNAFIDPHVHVWHYEIPVYLFLGGIVAGIMVLSTAAGAALDLWLGDRALDLAVAAGHHHETVGPLALAAAAVFTLLLLSALWRTKIRRS